MRFSLIICTYQRPKSLLRLLASVSEQDPYPDQILIIDGSENDETFQIIKENFFENLSYFKVDDENRGLTRQRNFGIENVSPTSKIISFLDDDIELTPSYFRNLINTYKEFPDALGVGGYIIEETKWRKVREDQLANYAEFLIDGFIRVDSSRYLLRKKLGLMAETFPTIMPPEGHGRSVGFIPPSGKTYKVETFMGGVSSFKKDVFDRLKFSSYFVGYGLYEDTDFTLRVSKIGNLYINTNAKLYHLHHQDGRPNQFYYGRMVVRNGWYVWRVKYPKPEVSSIFKWHSITVLLILVRLSNIFNTNLKKQALTESLGRVFGWLSIIFNPPKQML